MATLIDPNGEKYQIGSSHLLSGEGVPLEFLDEREALQFLLTLAQDPYNVASLRSMAYETGVLLDTWSLRDERLLSAIASELIIGQLIIVQSGEERRPVSYGARSSVEPGEPEPDEEPEAEPAPVAEELSWIKFKFVDNETGEPVSGVTLKVRLPDGAARSATSDGSGIIEIRDIPSGSCDIERMIDADVLEVVAVE